MPSDDTTKATDPGPSDVSGKEVGLPEHQEAGLGESEAHPTTTDEILAKLDPIESDEEDGDATAEEEPEETEKPADEDKPVIPDDTMKVLKRAGLDEDDIEALGAERAEALAKHQAKIQADTDAAFQKLKTETTDETVDGGETPSEADPGSLVLDLSEAIEEAALDLGEQDANAFGALVKAGVGQAFEKVEKALEQQAGVTLETQGLMDAMVASMVRGQLREDFPEIDDPARFTSIRARADMLAKDPEFVANLENRPDMAQAVMRDGPLALLHAIYEEASSIEFAKDGIKRKAKARATEHGARRNGQATRPGRTGAPTKGLKDMTNDERQSWVLVQLDKGRSKPEIEAELRTIA